MDSDDQTISCFAKEVAVELPAEWAGVLDPELVAQAAAAVLFYFRHERGRERISVGDFTAALKAVLRGFGFEVQAAATEASPRPRLAKANLLALACESGVGFELSFFPRLRAELRRQLDQAPQVLHFHGLRGCVKQLAGGRRWNRQCQRLHDQIADFLRSSLCAEARRPHCALLVQ